MRLPIHAIIWLCFWLLAVPSQKSWAHAGLDERVAAISRRIFNEGASADLYLRRAELYRLHAEWQAAEDDYRKAAALAPERKVVKFYHGRMLLGSGNPQAARRMLDDYLNRQRNHGEAYLVRARIWRQLGNPLAADKDYNRALQILPHAPPQYFVERARTLALAGSEYTDEALRGLDRGIERFCPLVALHRVALDIEIADRRYDAALKRLDDLVANSARKEMWLERQGQILLHVGRIEAAKQAFQDALRAIAELPPHRQQVRAFMQFKTRLQTQLQSSGDK